MQRGSRPPEDGRLLWFSRTPLVNLDVPVADAPGVPDESRLPRHVPAPTPQDPCPVPRVRLTTVNERSPQEDSFAVLAVAPRPDTDPPGVVRAAEAAEERVLSADRRETV